MWVQRAEKVGKEGLGVGAAIVNPQDQYGSGREKCRIDIE